MKLNGEAVIGAPRDIVWDALNDEALLVKCVSGCETLDRISDTDLAATLTVRLGPVKAKFKGDVKLENIDAPNSYRLVGEGKGAAGFARGHADVALAELEDGTGTRLIWVAEARVGGKLAQMGARLIDSTARKYADEFFERFTELTLERKETLDAVSPVSSEAEKPVQEPQAVTEPASVPEFQERKGLPPLVWVSLLIVAVLALLFGLVRQT